MTDKCKWCKKGKVFSQGICKECYIGALNRSPEVRQIIKQIKQEAVKHEGTGKGD